MGNQRGMRLWTPPGLEGTCQASSSLCWPGWRVRSRPCPPTSLLLPQPPANPQSAILPISRPPPAEDPVTHPQGAPRQPPELQERDELQVKSKRGGTPYNQDTNADAPKVERPKLTQRQRLEHLPAKTPFVKRTLKKGHKALPPSPFPAAEHLQPPGRQERRGAARGPKALRHAQGLPDQLPADQGGAQPVCHLPIAAKSSPGLPAPRCSSPLLPPAAALHLQGR